MIRRIAAAVETLALALWVGALAGFAFVFAPIAFHAIADRAIFGSITAQILRELGTLGAICGTLAIVLETAVERPHGPRGAAIRIALVGVMLLGTAVESFAILPQMTAMFGHGPLPPAFERLHHRSSLVYGIVLLCGLATIAQRAFTTRPQDLPAKERTFASPGRPGDGRGRLP